MTLEALSQTSLILTNLHKVSKTLLLVPHLSNLRLAHRRDDMGRNPNSENGDVDKSDSNSSAPFYPEDSRSMFGDDRDSVDDDLHKQLDFQDPEEENKEKNRYTRIRHSVSLMILIQCHAVCLTSVRLLRRGRSNQ